MIKFRAVTHGETLCDAEGVKDGDMFVVHLTPEQTNQLESQALPEALFAPIDPSNEVFWEVIIHLESQNGE